MKLSEVPIPVLVAGGIIVLFVVIFLGSFPFLSSSLDDSLAQNRRLTNEVRTTNTSIERARDDYTFVVENERRFEEAMASDEIIPHTRRAAARQMQTVAVENGLTSLNYNFAASGEQARGRGATPASSDSAYTLHVEEIRLEVGAPLDRPVYAFVEELLRTIPGTAVVRQLELSRAETITTDMLNRVATGQGSGIVTGTIDFSWRTAQANREAE